jgi:hypothetical protein
MRSIAVVLVAALLLPAVAAMTPGGGGACCCATGPGATCPMKRAGAECETSDAKTCGIQSSESQASHLPIIGIHRPALLTEVSTAGIHFVAVRFDAPSSHHATRARHAPDAPPPKFA